MIGGPWRHFPIRRNTHGALWRHDRGSGGVDQCGRPKNNRPEPLDRVGLL
jgi:hypothetical protein